MSSLLWLDRKKVFKCISNWPISPSFLPDKYVHKFPQFPRKPYPIPGQNGQNLYPFSDQKGANTIPFGAAHTYISYMAYIKESPSPSPSPPPLLWQYFIGDVSNAEWNITVTNNFETSGAPYLMFSMHDRKFLVGSLGSYHFCRFASLALYLYVFGRIN